MPMSLIHGLCRLAGVACHAGARRQNVIPICTSYARGARKCVPLNVESKLYRASVFVKLITLKRSRSFVRGVASRLSNPTPTFRTLRGAIRPGFVSGFHAAGETRLTRDAVRVPLHAVIGLVSVAATPPQDRPIATWPSASCASASANVWAPETSPESYRHVNTTEAARLGHVRYWSVVVCWNAWSWSMRKTSMTWPLASCGAADVIVCRRPPVSG